MAEVAKQSKKNISFSRMMKYFREVRAEMKKVTWPTWSQVRNNTLVVILSIIVVGVVIWTLDVIFGEALNYLLNR
ncbi:preprotein translocase subunit SecE [Petroclostridium sp. X23]|uniref:preprotein translocase subunit SecE n=1 Tax=Petroclostridium sp. X23 TaxID=3045146 RepID=UPI0024AD1647|nr:preprotein translocase subunit SecE [Petroclostridium sp. X23]WHH57459.1 preprotein translocase subunit SecE [Petroclostridium sp. X23]